MYRPCLHCEGKKYDENICPEICTYGEDRKRLKELEELDKRGKKQLAEKLKEKCVPLSPHSDNLVISRKDFENILVEIGG